MDQIIRDDILVPPPYDSAQEQHVVSGHVSTGHVPAEGGEKEVPVTET